MKPFMFLRAADMVMEKKMVNASDASIRPSNKR